MPTTGPGLFFIGSGGRQIGGINDRDGLAVVRNQLEQTPDQIVINRAQTSDTRAKAKLMQHAYIGHVMALRQARKAAPRALFRQQAHHRIEGMSRGQECEQMGAPKLRRNKGTSLPGTAPESQFGIDELIRNEV